MTDAVFKNYRNKVGRDGITRSSITPLLPADNNGNNNSKSENFENEGVDVSLQGSREDIPLSTTDSSTPWIRPEPQKRRSTSTSTDKPMDKPTTEKQTVYVEIEATAASKTKPKNKSRAGSIGNASLSTAINSEDYYKPNGEDYDDYEVDDDWCNIRPLKEAISVSMSAFYGIFITVLGVVVPVAETFAGSRSPDVFELYYIYLYGICFLFLIFLNRGKLLCRNKNGSCRTRMSRLCPSNSKGTYPVNDPEQDSDKDGKITIEAGNFHLRFAAMAFGVGSMIHSGLHFGQYFQVVDGEKLCHHVALAIKPFMHALFTFTQMYFIFMFAKKWTENCKTVVRFGLIHMCGTNLCILFRVIVVQTIAIIQKFNLQQVILQSPVTSTAKTLTSTSRATDNVSIEKMVKNITETEVSHQSVGLNLPEVTCYWYNVMGGVLETASPYLFPCTIQYSLICTGILYVMWRNVGNKTKNSKRKLSTITVKSSITTGSNETDKFTFGCSFDCKKSSRGLFLGILISVGAVITMIAFHVLKTTESTNGKAVILVHLTETALYIIMTLSVILAAERMKTLGFTKNKTQTLEDSLLIISFSGLLLFAMFSVLPALFETDKPHAVLIILTNIFMIVQASLQTVFILAGERMKVKNAEQERKKEGREIIIFLSLCNFSMWALNTFETQQPEHNPLQLKFYDVLAWSIITFITVPLGFFYRFHSALWLAKIWKNTWKLKQK